VKELVGHASNLVLAPDLDAAPRIKARVELIVICSEPRYGYGLEGLTRTRDVSEFRVLCGHEVLRKTAAKLLELADEAEELESRTNARLVDDDEAGARGHGA
jgi:hypothetical protein